MRVPSIQATASSDAISSEPKKTLDTKNLALAPRSQHPRRMDRLVRITERFLPLFVLTVALIGVPILIFSPEGLPRLRGLERELAEVEEDTAVLRREIETLRGKVARLRDDPTAVERIARDDLGLVRQTEVVFQFPTRK